MNTLGLYAGSFSPFHKGHLDIVYQSLQVFDKVLVAKGINPDKNNLFDNPLPVRFLNNMGVLTRNYDTLLVDLIKEWETKYNVILVRGLRNGSDLEYEQNMVAFLKDMYPQVKIVAFYCDPKCRHISSSSLRGIRKFSEREYDKYVVEDISPIKSAEPVEL
jgi:pantetheine-phosphate adenylyltransferase